MSTQADIDALRPLITTLTTTIENTSVPASVDVSGLASDINALTVAFAAFAAKLNPTA